MQAHAFRFIVNFFLSLNCIIISLVVIFFIYVHSLVIDLLILAVLTSILLN